MKGAERTFQIKIPFPESQISDTDLLETRNLISDVHRKATHEGFSKHIEKNNLPSISLNKRVLTLKPRLTFSISLGQC